MEILPQSDEPVLVQWLVDTRPLWPEATQTRQLATVACRALAALLTDEERAGVLKYFHVRDAKMALVSQLLKHLIVARCPVDSSCGVPWRQTVLTRDARGKPVYVHVDGATRRQPVVFNVSHQAGLVVLAAVYGGGALAADAFEVGIDVVSPSERRTRDLQMIAEEGKASCPGSGWPHFVDMHADVLCPREVQYLKRTADNTDRDRDRHKDTQTETDRDTDTRLRYFYALWCLREAYVKMTGEALLAEWLAELEFRDFRVPPLPDAGKLSQSAPMVTEHDIRFRGRQVGGAVNVCLRSIGTDYMVCTAVRSLGDEAAARRLRTADAFETLQMDDLLDFVERSERAVDATGNAA